MVRGKHGFERIVWAFKNVLNSSMTWLLCEPKGRLGDSEAMNRFSPIMKNVQPSIERLESVLIPPFPETVAQEETDGVVQLLEWLSLVTSSSPRVLQIDDIDSYLSRYEVPSDPNNGLDGETHEQVHDLVKLHWHGFIPPQFTSTLLSTTLKACGSSWFAFSASAFDGTEYTFLQNKQ